MSRPSERGGGEDSSDNAWLVYNTSLGNRCSEPTAICTPSCQASGATEQSSLNTIANPL